ncbi:MAG: glycosyltransferase family 4 protein [Methanomassiliicoccales archaeon]
MELNPFYTPYRGGIERRIEATTSRLSSRHECFVVTSRLPGTLEEEKIAGATVIRLKSTYFGRYNPPFVRTPGVGEALASLSPDVVDYHYRWAGSYNRPFFSFDGGKLVTFHNTFGEGTGLLRFLSVLNDAHYISRLKKGIRTIAVSSYVRDQLISHGIEPAQVEAIPNGIDMHRCNPSDEGFALFVGRLVPSKGLVSLVNAVRMCGVRTVIAGDGPLFSTLKRLSSGLPVELLGRIDEERKEELLLSCSFFVLPSIQESFGIAALEAMAHGKAVVVTATGGLPEVVGGGGLVVPVGDARSLASSMKRLAEDSELRLMMGRKAEERAHTFSWDRIVQSIERTYTAVVREYRPFSQSSDSL